MNNLSKTLESLEGEKWAEPEYNSHLVLECHRLRKVPLSQFTVENLRILIGQNMSLEYLIPIALEKLREDPFSGGDYDDGDLLKVVLSIKGEFWEEYPTLYVELENVMGSFQDDIDQFEEKVKFAKKEVFPLWYNYFK